MSVIAYIVHAASCDYCGAQGPQRLNRGSALAAAQADHWLVDITATSGPDLQICADPTCVNRLRTARNRQGATA